MTDRQQSPPQSEQPVNEELARIWREHMLLRDRQQEQFSRASRDLSAEGTQILLNGQIVSANDLGRIAVSQNRIPSLEEAARRQARLEAELRERHRSEGEVEWEQVITRDGTIALRQRIPRPFDMRGDPTEVRAAAEQAAESVARAAQVTTARELIDRSREALAKRTEVYQNISKITFAAEVMDSAVAMSAYRRRNPLEVSQEINRPLADGFLFGFDDHYPFIQTLRLPIAYALLQAEMRYSPAYGLIWGSHVVECVRWQWADEILGCISWYTDDGVYHANHTYIHPSEWYRFYRDWSSAPFIAVALGGLVDEAQRVRYWSEHVESVATITPSVPASIQPPRSHIRRGKRP